MDKSVFYSIIVVVRQTGYFMTSPVQPNADCSFEGGCETCPLQINAAENITLLRARGDSGVVVWQQEATSALENCEAGEPVITRHRRFKFFGRVITKLECATEAPHHFPSESHYERVIDSGRD